MKKEEEEKIEFEVLKRGNNKRISELHRFSLLCIGCVALVVAGFSYAFNLISDFIQALTKADQKGLSAISTCGTVLTYSILPYAFLFDYLGPIPVAIIATVLVSLGSLLFALTFTGAITGTVVRMCVFNAIMCHGTMLYDLVSCVTIMSYFPTLRGVTVALLKCYVGLGSSIIGCIRLGLFPEPDNFFFLLFAYALFCGILLIVFMRLPKYHLTGRELSTLSSEEIEERVSDKSRYLRQKPSLWRIIVGYVIIVIFIVYLPTQSALVNYKSLKKKHTKPFAIVTIVILFLNLLMCLPIPDRHRKSEEEEEEAEETGLEETPNEPVLVEPASVYDENGILKGVPVPYDKDNDNVPIAAVAQEETEVDFIAPQYQTSFLRNLLSLRLWCMFWTLFCLGGAEFTVISNPSYIYSAMAGHKTETSMRTLLSVLNGIGSAVGRLIMAAFEHLSQHRPPEKRVLITWAPFFPISLMTLSLIFFLACPASVTPLPILFTGLANGAQASHTVIVPRVIFAKDPAKHYNFCFVASALTAIVCLPFLWGEWYNNEAARTNGKDGFCFQRSCIKMPLGVLLGLVVSSALSSIYLHLHYRNFCKRVLAERRRLREEGGNREEVTDNIVPDE